MSNARNATRTDIVLDAFTSTDPLGPVQVYRAGVWVGGVYVDEPGEDWQVCHTDPDGSQPVRGTFATARLAAVALVERIEQRERATR